MVLKDFFDDFRNCDLLVGHNISFDINMVKVELLRLIYECNLIIYEDEIKSYKYDLHYLTNLIEAKNEVSVNKNSPKFDNPAKKLIKFSIKIVSTRFDF